MSAFNAFGCRFETLPYKRLTHADKISQMTVQLSDILEFQEERFVTLQLDDGDPLCSQDFVHPRDFGMKGQMPSTANRKGFSATYELSEDGLRLRCFSLCDGTGKYLAIDGVLPTISADGGYGSYDALNLPIAFSGKVRIVGKDG